MKTEGEGEEVEEVVALWLLGGLLGGRDFLHAASPPQGLSAPCSDCNEEARPCAAAVKGVELTCMLLRTGEVVGQGGGGVRVRGR